MKFLKNIVALACFAVMGMMALTSCEGSDLYKVVAPDWLSEKVDSIKNTQTGDGILYTFGKTDFSSGWWTDFSRYYVIFKYV